MVLAATWLDGWKSRSQPLNLQTTIIAQMLSIGGEGAPKPISNHYVTNRDKKGAR